MSDSVRPTIDGARQAMAAGQVDQAIELLTSLLTTHAHDASALQEAGVILAAAGRQVEALRFFQQSLLANPNFGRGHFNLALTLRALGRAGEAEASFRRAMVISPDAPEPVVELADLMGHSGRVGEAIGMLDGVADRFAASDRFHAMRGHLLKRDGRLLEAADALRRAMELSPRSMPIRCNLAFVLMEMGEVEQADAALAPMLAADPPASVRLRTALMLPGVVESAEQTNRVRARLDTTLDELSNTTERIADPMASLNSIPFFLAYAGKNDRVILEKLAAVHERMCPSLAYTAPHVSQRPQPRGRIRLGVVSTNLFSHTIGRLNVGLIEHLDRSRFEVFVLQNQIDDPIANRIRALADHAIPSPRAFGAIRQEIANAQLDVILYPDIGMVPLTYYLAFARLARLQCVTWGHPLTTGLRSLDYFISATHLETPGSQAHYTEHLHCLSAPGTCYAKPEHIPIPSPRAHFGFAHDWRLYVCPQSPFKVHPDFDPILARILREDPAARIVFVAGSHGAMFDVLRRRFAKSLGGDIERIVVLPKLGGDEFLSLLSLADANLDTLHFGGGNTSLEAFAVGCPIVTLPAEFLRGRITYAFYEQMRLRDCIARDADQYVQLALRLANDRAWHADQRRQILARNGVLFDNRDVIREFEAFVTAELQRKA